MNANSCVVGVDFGTLSGRAVVVRVRDGAELGSAVHTYQHGVIETTLPTTPPDLPSDALPGTPSGTPPGLPSGALPATPPGTPSGALSGTPASVPSDAVPGASSGALTGALPDALRGVSPGSEVRLGPDWALQSPQDWIDVLRFAVPQAIAAAGIAPSQVIGLGTDFTACTVLPTTADGTPLCFETPAVPHAWPKLWKHHAAQPYADRINTLAAERGEPWLPRYGGKISSEWEFAKALQVLEEDPEVYGRAERWIEAADWIVWQLTGVETRNTCTAGYKGIFQDGTYPSPDFFAALNPDFSDFVTKLAIPPSSGTASSALSMSSEHSGSFAASAASAALSAPSGSSGLSALPGSSAPSSSSASLGSSDGSGGGLVELAPLGGLAGRLTAQAAGWTGLPEGIAISVGNVDAHVTSAAADAVRPGQMVAIMGTSTCHVMPSDRLAEVPGMCGVVRDGIVPGLWGYEAGQSAVGDIFAWFVDNFATTQTPTTQTPTTTGGLGAGPGVARGGVTTDGEVAEGEATSGAEGGVAGDGPGVNVHERLTALAERQAVGEHGLVALDWFGGNRSVLVDHNLSGVIIGQTLATKPEDVYRALIESTAFGARMIVETFEKAGVPVEEFIVAGGLLKNRFLMQVYADVLRRPLSVIGSEQGPALGSAIHAAVAAGAYGDIREAAAAMGKRTEGAFLPDHARADAYDRLYTTYKLLHETFGDGRMLHTLRAIRNEASA